jgi:hypothetical protein
LLGLLWEECVKFEQIGPLGRGKLTEMYPKYSCITIIIDLLAFTINICVEMVARGGIVTTRCWCRVARLI